MTDAPTTTSPAPVPLRHPDVFTADEAAAYLHLENVATLDWLVENKFLTRQKIGRGFMYHKSDLDQCAYLMFGKQPPMEVLRTGARRAS